MENQKVENSSSTKKKKISYKATPFILQTIAILLLKPLFYFFIRFEVRGAHHLKKLKKGVVFAPNHTSYFDAGLVPVALPLFSKHVPMFYVSFPHKTYTIHEPGDFIFRSFLTESWGSFEFIPGKKDYAVSLRNHIAIVNDGCSLCIFPEGKISKDGVLRPEEARGGLGFIAKETGVPIVPVKIEGIAGTTMPQFFFRKRKVTVTFGPPVFFSEEDQLLPADENTYKQFSRKLLETIKTM